MGARRIDPPDLRPPAGGGPRSGAWTIEAWEGTAAELHSLDVPPTRLVRVNRVVRPALVMGSTQPLEAADAEVLARRGADLVRRRSGGGAVWLAPGEQVWVDLVIPGDDPLAESDVGRSGRWVGRAWLTALAGLPAGTAVGGTAVGDSELGVHRGPALRRDLGRLVCFAGVAEGEVVLGAGERTRKVVGVSQHRSRLRARFQCVVYRRWDPAPLVEALATELQRRPGATDALLRAAFPLPAPAGEWGWGVVERLISALP